MSNNVIVDYSSFFNDDGGFEKIKSDFKALGDDLIKDAKRIKEGINIFDLSDAEGIAEYEKMAENLTDSFKRYEKAKKDLTKVEDEFRKTQKKNLKATDLQSKNLAQLELQLSKYKKELKTNNALEKVGTKTAEESAEVRAELRVKIKAVTQEISKQQKEIIESTKLSKQEEKILKANITLQKGRATTLAEVRERLSALRIVASQVNITTQEGRDLVAEYNEEINELTDTLEENSDKFVQAKINVGNYEESIVNALNSSSLFKTNIAGLDNALGGLVALLTLSKEELAEMEEKLKKNSNALQRFAVSFGKLNKVLKASIIGVLLVSIAALASVFGDTRAGAARLEKVMSTLQRSLVAITEISKELFLAFTGLFSGIGDKARIFFLQTKLGFLQLTNAFDRNKEQIKEVAKELGVLISKQIEQNEKTKENGTLAERLAKIWNDSGKSIVKNLENIDRAFKLEDRIRRLNLELAKTTFQLEQQQAIADDSTKSLREQLAANRKALNLTTVRGKKEEEIARKELELANERLKANALQRAEENKGLDLRLKGEAFARATLDFAEKQGASLEISNNLLEEQQAALLRLREVENGNELQREENAKKRREIDRDLFEQNLDLLIDLIDTEKNLSEQLINDTTQNVQDRVIEYNRILAKFRENAQKELDEFTKFAKKSGKDLKFDIEFNEDGTFDVLQNGTKLSIDNIVELNKELQALGLAEIPINRLREFFVETRNGVKDFKDLGKAIDEVTIKTRELTESNSISDDELKRLDEINAKRVKLLESTRGRLSKSQRKKVLKELEELEQEKNRVLEFAEEKRGDIQLDSLDAQIKDLEDRELDKSEKYLELVKHRNDLERKLKQDAIKKELDDEKKKQEALIKLQEKREKEFRRIGGLILDQVLKSNQKQVSEQEKAISKQEKRLDTQRERADKGLVNTLKFEQEKQAEQEAELLKRQKRQERLEKIKAVYTSYSNFANAGEKNPLAKALRDFGILEAVTASFGDGGIVGIDGVRTNSKGVTQGRSHSMGKGVLAYHEGGEGFLSRMEMANLGEDNFRQIKDRAGLGPLNKNFFTEQHRDFTETIAIPTYSDKTLVTEVKEVSKAIRNKPEQSLDVQGLVDGILQFTETKKTGNKTRRHIYRIKKRRL